VRRPPALARLRGHIPEGTLFRPPTRPLVGMRQWRRPRRVAHRPLRVYGVTSQREPCSALRRARLRGCDRGTGPKRVATGLMRVFAVRSPEGPFFRPTTRLAKVPTQSFVARALHIFTPCIHPHLTQRASRDLISFPGCGPGQVAESRRVYCRPNTLVGYWHAQEGASLALCSKPRGAGASRAHHCVAGIRLYFRYTSRLSAGSRIRLDHGLHFFPPSRLFWQ
jgi:hypothetical protein